MELTWGPLSGSSFLSQSYIPERIFPGQRSSHQPNSHDGETGQGDRGEIGKAADPAQNLSALPSLILANIARLITPLDPPSLPSSASLQRLGLTETLLHDEVIVAQVSGDVQGYTLFLWTDRGGLEAV